MKATRWFNDLVADRAILVFGYVRLVYKDIYFMGEAYFLDFVREVFLVANSDGEFQENLVFFKLISQARCFHFDRSLFVLVGKILGGQAFERSGRISRIEET